MFGRGPQQRILLENTERVFSKDLTLVFPCLKQILRNLIRSIIQKALSKLTKVLHKWYFLNNSLQKKFKSHLPC